MCSDCFPCHPQVWGGFLIGRFPNLQKHLVVFHSVSLALTTWRHERLRKAKEKQKACMYVCMVCMVCMVWYVWSTICIQSHMVCMYVWYVCMVCMVWYVWSPYASDMTVDRVTFPIWLFEESESRRIWESEESGNLRIWDSDSQILRFSDSQISSNTPTARGVGGLFIWF